MLSHIQCTTCQLGKTQSRTCCNEIIGLPIWNGQVSIASHSSVTFEAAGQLNQVSRFFIISCTVHMTKCLQYASYSKPLSMLLRKICQATVLTVHKGMPIPFPTRLGILHSSSYDASSQTSGLPGFTSSR